MNRYYTTGTTTASDTIGRSFTFDPYISSNYYTSTTTSAADNIYSQHTGTYTGYEYYNSEYYAPIRSDISRVSQSILEQQPEPRPERPEPQPPKPDPEEVKLQKKAQELSRQLLLEHLESDNRQRYVENKPIEVNSGLFNDIKYQIPISKLDKICAVKNGQTISRLCLVVKEPEHIPLEDVILTKLLHILHDEECVLRTANHSSVAENLLARLN